MNETEITDMHENGEVQEPESDPAGEDVGVVKLFSPNSSSVGCLHIMTIK